MLIFSYEIWWGSNLTVQQIFLSKWHPPYVMLMLVLRPEHSPNSGLMLGQCLRRWANINPELITCVVCAVSICLFAEG